MARCPSEKKSEEVFLDATITQRVKSSFRDGLAQSWLIKPCHPI